MMRACQMVHRLFPRRGVFFPNEGFHLERYHPVCVAWHAWSIRNASWQLREVGHKLHTPLPWMIPTLILIFPGWEYVERGNSSTMGNSLKRNRITEGSFGSQFWEFCWKWWVKLLKTKLIIFSPFSPKKKLKFQNFQQALDIFPKVFHHRKKCHHQIIPMARLDGRLDSQKIWNVPSPNKQTNTFRSWHFPPVPPVHFYVSGPKMAVRMARWPDDPKWFNERSQSHPCP